MKKLTAITLIGFAFVTAVVFPDNGRHASVGAQVATPQGTATAMATPSPTSTAAPPDPVALVQNAQKAFAAAGSGHVDGQIQLHVSGSGGGDVSAQLTGNVQWKSPTKAHLKGSIGAKTTSKGSTVSVTTPVEVIVTPKYLAIRAPSTRPSTKKWSCSSLASVAGSANVPKGTIASTPTVHTLKPTLVGTTVINGVAVWQVHESAWDVVKSGKTKTKETVSEDMYISQADSTILRITGTLKSGSGKNEVSGTYSANLSSYGESVKVAVPKACTAKVKKPKLNELSLRALNFISNPVGLMRVVAH